MYKSQILDYRATFQIDIGMRFESIQRLDSNAKKNARSRPRRRQSQFGGERNPLIGLHLLLYGTHY
jgi:hypothetical protein